MNRQQHLRILPARSQAALSSHDNAPSNSPATGVAVFWSSQRRAVDALIRCVRSPAFDTERAPSWEAFLSKVSLDPHAVAVLVVDADALLPGGLLTTLDGSVVRRVLPLLPDADETMLRAMVPLGFADFAILPIRGSELTARIELRVRDARMRTQYAQSENPKDDNVSSLIAGAGTGWPIRLTRRELALFRYLAASEGRVVSRAELLTNVWGKSGADSRTSNVVDVYVCYLRTKLATLAPTVRITTVQSAGYLVTLTSDAPQMATDAVQ